MVVEVGGPLSYGSIGVVCKGTGNGMSSVADDREKGRNM